MILYECFAIIAMLENTMQPIDFQDMLISLPLASRKYWYKFHCRIYQLEQKQHVRCNAERAEGTLPKS